jgi:hypothetical protein
MDEARANAVAFAVMRERTKMWARPPKRPTTSDIQIAQAAITAYLAATAQGGEPQG